MGETFLTGVLIAAVILAGFIIWRLREWAAKYIHPKLGYRDWKDRLQQISRNDKIHGLERLFARCTHLLHVVTLSGWIKFSFDPLSSPPFKDELDRRNVAIEIWVVLELAVLVAAAVYPSPVGFIRIVLASYLLFEILLNLCSIVFVGKLEGVYPATPSIERSLLLFGFNVLQVILIFAIFYRAALGVDVRIAIFDASIVLATIGSPDLDAEKHWWWLVTLQTLTDLGLLVVFLGAFVGNLQAFKRTPVHPRPRPTSPPP